MFKYQISNSHHDPSCIDMCIYTHIHIYIYTYIYLYIYTYSVLWSWSHFPISRFPRSSWTPKKMKNKKMQIAMKWPRYFHAIAAKSHRVPAPTNPHWVLGGHATWDAWTCSSSGSRRGKAMENLRSYGKWTIYRWFTYSNSEFSIAILVYQRVIIRGNLLILSDFGSDGNIMGRTWECHGIGM